MQLRLYSPLMYLFILSISLFLQACGGKGLDLDGTGSATPTPTATPTPPGSGDTVVIGQPGLCSAGDVARVDVDTAGKARFSLISEDTTCSPAKDNRREEYTLIMYNTTASSMSFRIDSPVNASPPSSLTSLRVQQGEPEDPPVSAPQSSVHYTVGITETNEEATNLARLIPKKKRKYGRSSLTQRTLASYRALSVNDEVEFRIRSNPSDNEVFTTTSAMLWAQGTRCNIFVDRKHPVVQSPATATDADTFTTDQLKTLATIFDDNIYKLETAILGEPSDVDGDGRINILITPVLNSTLEVDSYTDSRNVLPFEPIANPISNESEVIYLFAPDSLGNYNPLGQWGFTATQYLSKTVAAWLAFQLAHIISYNQHVLLLDEDENPTAEKDWIDDGIGALMADLAGFNIWRDSVFLTLGQPHLDDLRKSEDLDYRSFEGAEYLFMLYYFQSQIDTTVQDTNADGIDDDISTLGRNLMTSQLTDIEGLEAAVDYTFDSEKETEFQAIFKDWTIAVATSGSGRTDLQQSSQTALKYFFTLNPTNLGSGVANSSGSVRPGASGFEVGLDLNGFHNDDDVLIENANEHVWAPGNSFFGFIDPFSAMYVRLGGLFQSTQTLSVKGSTNSIKGFLVRRTNISFPRVYSESKFGSIDQHAEDLDSASHNPFWPKKVDLEGLIGTSNDGALAKEFISIIGRIDAPGKIKVCPAEFSDGECPETNVPDTDKYTITIPNIAGHTNDEGDLALAVYRQHDDGEDGSGLEPMLAIVSSKDVPYPYLPHPVRGGILAGPNNSTRQQYRWMISSLICGDEQDTDPYLGLQNDTTTFTNLGIACTVAGDEDSSKIVYDGLAENTGTIPIRSNPTTIHPSSPWDGNVLGQECDALPNLSQNQALGVSSTGYGNIGTSALDGPYFGVTVIETSPSSLGRYAWSSDSFMEFVYDGFRYPDVLFDREFLKNVSGYPSEDPDSMYDPRSANGSTLNCHVDFGAGTDPDETPDSPDDLLEPGEIHRPTTLAQQILAEMSRGRRDVDGTKGSPAVDEITAISAISSGKYNDSDVFAIDGDSRDDDIECNTGDFGNNVNPFTVRKNEGSILWGNYSFLEPHIASNLNNSQITSVEDANQLIYRPNNPITPTTNPVYGGTAVTLTPGKSYTIIVAGNNNSVGNYELRIRKVDRSRINDGILVLLDANNIKCDFKL